MSPLARLLASGELSSDLARVATLMLRGKQSFTGSDGFLVAEIRRRLNEIERDNRMKTVDHRAIPQQTDKPAKPTTPQPSKPVAPNVQQR